MQWQFSEANDPDNKGRMTARLVYGVPETDNVQVTGVCDAGPSTGVKFSSVTFGADIGADLKYGTQVELGFSGGGFKHVMKGSIHRPSAEEGIAGVHLDIEHNDPLWQALQQKDSLDYLVPGYRANTLDMTRGRDKIKSFVEACRTYAEVILGDDNKTADAAPPAGGSGEKDAFEAAKELGTKEAWEAFLANYGSGFHADLARAYLKKLAAGGASAPSNAGNGDAAAGPAIDPQALGPVVSGISKAPDTKSLASSPYPAKRSCSERGSLRSGRYDTPAKVRFVHYSGDRRDMHWLDYAGQAHNFITLKPGQQVTAETFLTHPWMITDGAGNCLEIVLPRPGTSVVRFGNPPAPVKTTSSKKCRRGYLRIEGKCIKKRDAASYCGPGYRVQGGKCVQGYKAPPPQAQRPSWQIEAIKKGCAPGMGWNAQEGCHEND